MVQPNHSFHRLFVDKFFSIFNNVVTLMAFEVWAFVIIIPFRPPSDKIQTQRRIRSNHKTICVLSS